MLNNPTVWGAFKDRVENGIYDFVGIIAPTSGTSGSGAGFAALGSTYLDTVTGNRYRNTGTAASPTWTLVALNPTVGTALTSSATIAPTNAIHHVTGTVPIATITLPNANFQGQITLIPDGIFTTATTGNIALASTAVVNKALIMTYDGTKWIPSY